MKIKTRLAANEKLWKLTTAISLVVLRTSSLTRMQRGRRQTHTHTNTSEAIRFIALQYPAGYCCWMAAGCCFTSDVGGLYANELLCCHCCCCCSWLAYWPPDGVARRRHFRMTLYINGHFRRKWFGLHSAQGSRLWSSLRPVKTIVNKCASMRLYYSESDQPPSINRALRNSKWKSLKLLSSAVLGKRESITPTTGSFLSTWTALFVRSEDMNKWVKRWRQLPGK